MDPTEKKDKIWSVSEVNQVVKDLLEQSLYPFWISGELSNLTVHRSGHVYFSLKDTRAQLRAVFFNGAREVQGLGLKRGMKVEAYGRLTVYETRGDYQLSVRRIRPGGLGALQQQFEETKRRLQAEGLFSEARKRPLPLLPACVGVVTSPNGAALRDFLQIVGRRFPGLHVRIFPATVQGKKTASEVKAGIESFNRQGGVDVIVVTRGGGSLEDLWGFNDEALARTVAASRIPVISAVGHEVDFSICDFAADLRAPTPSAAAELVIGRRDELLDRIGRLRRSLRQTLELKLSRLRNRVQRAALHPILREPVHLVRRYQQRVDELSMRLQAITRRRVERDQERLLRVLGQLRVLDPGNVMRRGYAIVFGAHSHVPLTRATDTAVGETARVRLAQGELAVTINAVHPPPDSAETPGSSQAQPEPLDHGNNQGEDNR